MKSEQAADHKLTIAPLRQSSPRLHHCQDSTAAAAAAMVVEAEVDRQRWGIRSVAHRRMRDQQRDDKKGKAQAQKATAALEYVGEMMTMGVRPWGETV